MGNNLITLLMGSTYLVGGQTTRGLRFKIGDANPSTILERMMNNHLFSIIEFFKTTAPFKDDLAYRKLCKLKSIGFISYYLTDMGNVVFLNTARYSKVVPEYVVYLPHQIDETQKRHIHKLLERNKNAKFTILYNLGLDENNIPIGDTLFDASYEAFFEMI